MRHEELMLEMASIKRTNQHTQIGAAAPLSAPLTPTSPWKMGKGCDLSPSESASSVGEFKRAELAALFQHNGGSTPSSTTTTHHPTLNSTALQAAGLPFTPATPTLLHTKLTILSFTLIFLSFCFSVSLTLSRRLKFFVHIIRSCLFCVFSRSLELQAGNRHCFCVTVFHLVFMCGAIPRAVLIGSFAPWM